MVSVINKLNISAKYWSNYSDRAKIEVIYSEKISHCHCVQHESHVDCPGNKLGLPRCEVGNYERKWMFKL